MNSINFSIAAIRGVQIPGGGATESFPFQTKLIGDFLVVFVVQMQLRQLSYRNICGSCSSPSF